MCCVGTKQQSGTKRVPYHGKARRSVVPPLQRRPQRALLQKAATSVLPNEIAIGEKEQARPLMQLTPQTQTVCLGGEERDDEMATTTPEASVRSLERLVDSVRNEVETDQQQREDLNDIQDGMERLRRINSENALMFQCLQTIRADPAAAAAWMSFLRLEAAATTDNTTTGSLP